MTQNERRLALIRALRTGAVIQQRAQSGWNNELHQAFDQLDVDLTDDIANESLRLSVSLAWQFFEHWVDAANHGFASYASAYFEEHEWPVLARLLANDLEAGRAVRDARLLAVSSWPPPIGSPHANARVKRWAVAKVVAGMGLGAMAGATFAGSAHAVWASSAVGAALGGVLGWILAGRGQVRGS